MKEFTEYQISWLMEAVLESKDCDKLFSGELYSILDINVDEIINRFNNGDFEVLKEENCQRLINFKMRAQSVFLAIMKMKKLLECKDFVMKMIEKKKNNMSYNPQEKLSYGKYSQTYSYEEFFQLIEKVEKVLKDKRLYQLLNFLLKNESLFPEFYHRIKLFEKVKNNPEPGAKLLEVLKKEDSKVGIIRIEEDDKVSISAGTKKDMEISDLIGRPFKADCENPGRWYGPYDDYWMEPHKVKKTFYEHGETKLHARMISLETDKRRTLSYYSSEEIGYIHCSDYALIISRRELISYGIDPESIGWKPLRLERNPKTIFSLDYENTHVLIPTALSLKKDELVSKLTKKR